ncbi:hypothetical protein ACLOJK_032367 [Asimina triloba]
MSHGIPRASEALTNKQHEIGGPNAITRNSNSRIDFSAGLGWVGLGAPLPAYHKCVFSAFSSMALGNVILLSAPVRHTQPRFRTGMVYVVALGSHSYCADLNFPRRAIFTPTGFCSAFLGGVAARVSLQAASLPASVPPVFYSVPHPFDTRNSIMISAAKNISQEWDSTHRRHHHHLQHHCYTNHQQQNLQLQDHDHDHPIKESDQLDLDQDEKEEVPIYDQAVMTSRKRSLSGKADVGISGEGRTIQKVCADCKTSKTPLWRSGPAGPKSLCNACGIRYRKRRRADILGGGNVGMKEKRRKENVLFLLQRKFPGREDAEAAVLLMALSCGLFVHT